MEPLATSGRPVAMAVVCEACANAVITNGITPRSAQLPDSSKQLWGCNSQATWAAKQTLTFCPSVLVPNYVHTAADLLQHQHIDVQRTSHQCAGRCIESVNIRAHKRRLFRRINTCAWAECSSTTACLLCSNVSQSETLSTFISFCLTRGLWAYFCLMAENQQMTTSRRTHFWKHPISCFSAPCLSCLHKLFALACFSEPAFLLDQTNTIICL